MNRSTMQTNTHTCRSRFIQLCNHTSKLLWRLSISVVMTTVTWSSHRTASACSNQAKTVNNTVVKTLKSHPYSETQNDRWTDRRWMNVSIDITEFLPARSYACAGLCDSNVSVCPSVRPSVCHTPVLCQNVMISSLSGSSTILVFWRQISSRRHKGSPSPRAGASYKAGVKFNHFLAFSINISKTVADKAKVTIND